MQATVHKNEKPLPDAASDVSRYIRRQSREGTDSL